MLPRHISGVNLNNPELNRSQGEHEITPRDGDNTFNDASVSQLPLVPKTGNCASTIPLLPSSLLLPTYIPPFFCPQKVHYSHGAVSSQGRSAALYCASRFPLSSSRNTIQQRRKLKDEMEDGGKRSRGVTAAAATTTMRRWTMDSG